MKRTVFLALALFALTAAAVFAQTEADFQVSKSKDGKSVTITNYKGKVTTVNIPAMIQNLPVVGVFIEKNNTITELTLPNGVGTFAVTNCTKLTKLTIGNGITRFENRLISNCPNLTTVNLPDSVTNIADNSFKGLAKLTSITIPASVTFIGIGTFQNCSSLASITIPASVTGIGADAFRGCDNLTSVTFAGSIPANGFHNQAFFISDIRDKYLAGGAGTYTRPSGGTTWTKQ